MKTFWKVLGFAALATGLTPYKVDKNEETGENSYQALLWRGSSKRAEGDSSLNIHIHLGEGTLTSKIMNTVEKKKEAHLFSDELSVEYHVTDDDADDETDDEAGGTDEDHIGTNEEADDEAGEEAAGEAGDPAADAAAE